jgi:hypothetical protein
MHLSASVLELGVVLISVDLKLFKDISVCLFHILTV